jgi:hypothetical protein
MVIFHSYVSLPEGIIFVVKTSPACGDDQPQWPTRPTRGIPSWGPSCASRTGLLLRCGPAAVSQAGETGEREEDPGMDGLYPYLLRPLRLFVFVWRLGWVWMGCTWDLGFLGGAGSQPSTRQQFLWWVKAWNIGLKCAIGMIYTSPGPTEESVQLEAFI